MPNKVATGRQLASVALRFHHPWERCTSGGWGQPTSLARRPIGGGVPSQPLEGGSRLRRLEAVLFLANEPLTSRRLAQLASLADGTQARTLIGQLNQTYDAGARAFRVEEVAGGYQLRTRPEFSRWIRRMVGAPPEIRISGPSLETLAVVAYRQPVLRTEIEAIRGVQCGEILRQLMERGMVRIVGRSQELGRPFLYGTTRNFLQIFGLRSLDELPRASMLRKSETAENRQTDEPQEQQAEGDFHPARHPLDIDHDQPWEEARQDHDEEDDDYEEDDDDDEDDEDEDDEDDIDDEA